MDQEISGYSEKDSIPAEFGASDDLSFLLSNEFIYSNELTLLRQFNQLI